MAAFDGQIFTVALVLFVFVEIGTCLQCYSCTSGPDEICDDTFSRFAHQNVPLMSCEYSPHLSKPGAGPNTHCGKTKKLQNKVHGVNNINDYVFRGCVPENFCRLVKSEVSECEICETERCNSSSHAIPSLIFCIVSLLLVRLNL